MPLAQIANGDTGLATRTKLNLVIDEINNIGLKVDQATLDAEAVLRSNADGVLTAALDAEVIARAANDNALDARIDALEISMDAADGVLTSALDSEVLLRIAGDLDLNSRVDDEINIRSLADSALDTRIDNESASRELAVQTVNTKVDTEIADRQSNDDIINTKIDGFPSPSSVNQNIRPGDAPDFFTETLSGKGAVLSPYPKTSAIVDSEGTVIRVTGANVIAQRAEQRLGTGRLYRLRMAFRRRTDPVDPANDTVRLGIQWLSQTGLALSQTVLSDIDDLVVSQGRQEQTMTIATAAGVGIDHVAPVGTVYARPFLQTFGGPHETDIEIIDFHDVSDLSLVSPDVSSVTSAVAAIESLMIDSRLITLEGLYSGPEVLNFKSKTAAVSSTIPVSVDILITSGSLIAGDGITGTYKREAIEPVSGDYFQSADLAWWKLVSDTKDDFDTVAELKASVKTYTDYAEGDNLLAQGFRFVVANGAAADFHIENAGGVRFYALPNGSGDCSILQWGVVSGQASISDEFIESSEYCALNGYGMIYPKGLWISDTIATAQLTGHLRIKNYGTMETGLLGKFRFQPLVRQFHTLTADANRLDPSIHVTDGSTVEIGHMLDVYDTGIIVEVDWSYYAAGSYTIINKNVNELLVSRNLLWGITAASPTLNVSTAEYIQVSIEGGEFSLNQPGGNLEFYQLDCVVKDMQVSTPDENSNNVWGFGFTSCTVHLSNCLMTGLSYGSLLNRCRDSVFDTIEARNVRAAVDNATWTYNVMVSNVNGQGCSGLISSHPSFDISFMNVDERNSLYAPSPRIAGLTVKNCYYHCLGASGSYGSRLIFTDMSVWDEFETVYEDSEFYAPNAAADGQTLACQYGARATFRNVTASDITIGATEVNFIGGRIGSIRIIFDNSMRTLRMTDLTFDPDLYWTTGYCIYLDKLGLDCIIANGVIFESNGPTAFFLDSNDESAGDARRFYTNCEFRGGPVKIVHGYGQANFHRFSDCYSTIARDRTTYANSNQRDCINIA